LIFFPGLFMPLAPVIPVSIVVAIVSGRTIVPISRANRHYDLGTIDDRGIVYVCRRIVCWRGIDRDRRGNAYAYSEGDRAAGRALMGRHPDGQSYHP
jgi:hypothetical protein